ncbi:5-methylcytosine restriction system specificity protein McrC [Halorubrum halophilum]|uniref:5-methylcytosine restriction system specificity protein McrC n=1 Tax=Halorubrum halophilum TaxID=413816 RepID=UPI0009E4552A|nr:hypothetical protein [Halorubrum halophilum]
MSSSALPNRVEIQERNEKTINNCPPEIGEQLQRAAFDKVAANEFEKTRTTRESKEERSVVKATVDEGSLTISVEDVVGVVNLTPTSKLQINPKIGWEEILEMFLAIQRRNRSLRYHGIPIDDFLSEDIEIEDIFVVIAINYLNSLQPIHRNGFIRHFKNEQYDAVSGRGRIDVEKSLLNKAHGVPKHRFVKKNIDYSTPVNSLIYLAGKQLLQLFQDSSSEYNHKQYFQIFSSLREEVRHLEDLGVSTDCVDLHRVKTTDISDLPRQRRYYSNAVKTSKTIISSTTGQSLESGREDLTVDFILDMDQVFETFSQITLEKEVEYLNELDPGNVEEKITVEEEPTLQVFNDDTVATYRPDHVLKNSGDTVAVLDSKYYSRHNDPSQQSEVRSRMLSYAFLLDSTEMVFLCPFGDTISRDLESRDGSITLVRPGEDFSIESYRRSIKDYLESLFDVNKQIESLREDIQYPIAHTEVENIDLDIIDQFDIFRVSEDNLTAFSRGVRRSAIRLSNEVARFDNLPRNKRHDLLDEIKNGLSMDEKYNYCIPVFIRDSKNETIPNTDQDWDGEAIKYYHLEENTGKIVDVSEPGYIKLKW